MTVIQDTATYPDSNETKAILHVLHSSDSSGSDLEPEDNESLMGVQRGDKLSFNQHHIMKVNNSDYSN